MTFTVVIRRCNFDNVRATGKSLCKVVKQMCFMGYEHEIQASQPSDDALDFSACPSSSLGGTSYNPTEYFRSWAARQNSLPGAMPGSIGSDWLVDSLPKKRAMHTDHINIKTVYEISIRFTIRRGSLTSSTPAYLRLVP